MHVLITGATGGLGRALARELIGPADRVTLVGRRRSALDELKRGLGVNAQIVEADLVVDPVGWLPHAVSAFGPIDVLVNNAGSVLSGGFSGVSESDARAIIALDLLAPLLLVRAVLPEMVERSAGTIINVTSTGALAPNPGMVHYCAAKAGLAAASESLRGELRGTGVKVLTVYPGPMHTAMLGIAHAGYPKLRRVTSLPTAQPEVVARQVHRAIERGTARVIYPRVYTVFRYLPGVARWLLDRFTPKPLTRDGETPRPPLARGASPVVAR